MSKLYELTGELLELEAMMSDPDIDPNIVKDTMEGIQMEFEEKLEGCGKIIRNMNGELGALDEEIKRLQARKRVCENGIKRMKKYIISNIQALDKKSVKTGLFLFTVKGGVNRAIVPDENAVPKGYRIKVPDKIDTAGIKKYLESGKSLDYAYLEKGDPSLLMK